MMEIMDLSSFLQNGNNYKEIFFSSASTQMQDSKAPTFLYDFQGSDSSDQHTEKKIIQRETEVSQKSRQLSLTVITPQVIKVNPYAKSHDNYSEESEDIHQYHLRDSQRGLMDGFPSHSSLGKIQRNRLSRNRQMLQKYEQEMIEKISNNSEECDSSDEQESDQQDREEMPRIKMVRSQPSVKMTIKKTPIIIQNQFDKVITKILPIGYKIVCMVNIESRFLGMSSKYSLHLKQNKQFLLSAKKELIKLNSSFIISKNQGTRQIHKRDSTFVGLLTANFVGTQFTFHLPDSEAFILSVNYGKNFMGYSGLRDMEVMKPKPGLEKAPHTLTDLLQRGENIKIEKLDTVKPKKGKTGWKLDFKGKAKLASGKNFILKDRKERECLLFAKQDDSNFLMEVTYPLSILEGFIIALSSLDSKLLCN